MYGDEGWKEIYDAFIKSKKLKYNDPCPICVKGSNIDIYHYQPKNAYFVVDRLKMVLITIIVPYANGVKSGYSRQNSKN